MAKDRAYAVRLSEHEWHKLEALATIHHTAASKIARDMVTASLDRNEKPLERRAEEWVISRLGRAAMAPPERALRLMEECVELAQAEGVTLAQALAQVTHVFERPAGERIAEAGGVAFTLLAWCAARNMGFRELALTELDRLAKRPPSDVQASVERKLAAGLMHNSIVSINGAQIDLDGATVGPRTWASEWQWMMEHKAEAQARFLELAAGRDLPVGFGDWPRDQKIVWLEKNWSLD